MPKLGYKIDPAQGISPDEFSSALVRLWTNLGQRSTRPQRIGIAVSGGVDSMALAWLCTSLRRHPRHFTIMPILDFKAYIVDHKARLESTQEAIKTQERLQQIGLLSKVISLKWPSGISPMDRSNFETQARRLRYQALGRACKDDGRNMLFVAHHSDDNAETILMRLAAGHKGAGLTGIPSASNMPESWGIHGVYESVESEHPVASGHSLTDSDSIEQRKQQSHKIPGSDDCFETGGIQMLRPLLSFTKLQLVETCLSGLVPWEEDMSNQDVTQTSRNSIRSLLRNDRLPQALRKESLQGLAIRSKIKRQGTDAAARAYYDDCKLESLELRSGRLLFRVPSRSDARYHDLDSDTCTSHRIAVVLIRWLTELISPYEEVLLGQLHLAGKAISSDLDDPSNTIGDRNSRITNFTAGGVHFQRIRHPVFDSKLIGNLDQDFIWSLSRQAFSSPPKPWIIPSMAHFDSPTSKFSPWTLWDGRYWIRVLNLTPIPLVVRPLRASDLTRLRAILSKKSWFALHNLLGDVAPGKIRYTLPTIAVSEACSRDPSEVLALPTLGRAGNLELANETLESKFEVEVRYKAIRGLRTDEPGNRLGIDASIVKTWRDQSQ